MGKPLAYRFYPSQAGKVVLLLHGSAGSSASVHALAKGLARQGAAAVYALDVRGHGASGPRGDVKYIDQLDDDLADLSSWIRARHPGQALLLAGFPATGGLALRMAASPQGACSTATCCWPHIWVPLRRRIGRGAEDGPRYPCRGLLR